MVNCEYQYEHLYTASDQFKEAETAGRNENATLPTTITSTTFWYGNLPLTFQRRERGEGRDGKKSLILTSAK